MKTYFWPKEWVPNVCKFEIITKGISTNNSIAPIRRYYGHVYQYWAGSYQFLSDQDWREKQAFLLDIVSEQAILRLFDPHRCVPRGVASGLNRDREPFSDGQFFSDGTGWSDGSTFGALFQGGARGDKTIKVGGLIPSQQKSISAGDLFEIGGYLYMAARGAASDEFGAAEITISTPLRSDIMAGEAVNFSYPTSPFWVEATEAPSFDRNAANYGAYSFNFVEAIPI